MSNIVRYQSLVSAIYERYSELSEGVLSDSESPTSTSISSCPESGISFYIPTAYSPRKTQSGLVMSSISLVMSDQKINRVGDSEELGCTCANVRELDLSKNEINDWVEIRKLLSTMKRLRFLNLSHNSQLSKQLQQNPAFTTDLSKNNDDDDEQSLLDSFDSQWPAEYKFEQLNILILNACFIKLQIVEKLLERLPNLVELHLASNNYSLVNFSPHFTKSSIEIVYFNNNNVSTWSEVCNLGKCFPNLKNLVISHNEIQNFSVVVVANEQYFSKYFSNLEILILNKLRIDEWSTIDQLRHFPQLKHVRIQNIPLLTAYNDDEKYYLLVSHLDESIQSLNGSEITGEVKENCERKFIRHWMDAAQKPKRYFELEMKHGKLNKLADVRLEGKKLVSVKIKFRDEHVYEKIDVRQTVGDFKKQLEKFVGHPASRFRVYYIDIEAMSVYGPEELKYLNRCLYSFNIRDGDEFEIDLKQAVSMQPSTSEQQFQHNYLNNQLGNCSAQQKVRNRKISEPVATENSSTSCSRSSKKTRPAFIRNVKLSEKMKSENFSLPNNLYSEGKIEEKSFERRGGAVEESGTLGRMAVVFTSGDNSIENSEN